MNDCWEGLVGWFGRFLFRVRWGVGQVKGVALNDCIVWVFFGLPPEDWVMQFESQHDSSDGYAEFVCGIDGHDLNSWASFFRARCSQTLTVLGLRFMDSAICSMVMPSV